MSGFIGLSFLFKALEERIEQKLTEEGKKSIRKTLYPLSIKNPYNITKKEIQQEVKKLQLPQEYDLGKVKEFLVNYLHKNIKNML